MDKGIDLQALISKKLNDGWDCASAKNLGDWYFGEYPKAYNRENNKPAYLFLAAAAWHLSDYVRAAEMYRYLQENYPECNETDKGYMWDRLAIFAVMEKLAPIIDCPDERLYAILHRLRYVFHAINLPIRVFIATSNEEYCEFFRQQFPGEVIYPYDDFGAVGFYYDRYAYWLVCKREYIDRLNDEELTGHCAHELAHFDLNSNGVTAQFKAFPELNKVGNVNNMMINERLTDLYVMAKGLAYPLYQVRVRCGASNSVLTADNIKEYILKLG